MLLTCNFKFAAAHHLTGKAAEPVHGHNYSVVVTITGVAGKDGMIMDKRELKKIVNEKVISKLDHTNLNELMDQPTMENLARWVWQQLKELPLYEVKVGESDTSFVTMNKNDDVLS